MNDNDVEDDYNDDDSDYWRWLVMTKIGDDNDGNWWRWCQVALVMTDDHWWWSMIDDDS